ncbi:MAG: hypothetical protein WCJ17_01350 [bacterium]
MYRLLGIIITSTCLSLSGADIGRIDVAKEAKRILTTTPLSFKCDHHAEKRLGTKLQHFIDITAGSFENRMGRMFFNDIPLDVLAPSLTPVACIEAIAEYVASWYYHLHTLIQSPKTNPATALATYSLHVFAQQLRQFTHAEKLQPRLLMLTLIQNGFIYIMHEARIRQYKTIEWARAIVKEIPDMDSLIQETKTILETYTRVLEDEPIGAELNSDYLPGFIRKVSAVYRIILRNTPSFTPEAFELGMHIEDFYNALIPHLMGSCELIDITPLLAILHDPKHTDIVASPTSSFLSDSDAAPAAHSSPGSTASSATYGSSCSRKNSLEKLFSLDDYGAAAGSTHPEG